MSREIIGVLQMRLQKDFELIVLQNEIIQFVEETLAIFINLQHKMESWSNFTKNRKYRTGKT